MNARKYQDPGQPDAPLVECPSYLALVRPGELAGRSRELIRRLDSCDVCPRACEVDRNHGAHGFCRTGRHAVIASACAHHGEEPSLSGTRGSGTIFFANCNLRCIYCQNFQISQGDWPAQPVADGAWQLADAMLHLQREGCHNINLVSPSHVVPQIVEAVARAAPEGLRLPLVYNTNAYDSVDVLRMLDGVVDIYLPDLKYASDRVAERFSSAGDYVSVSRAAIAEMYRQVGDRLTFNDDGTTRRGLIVRHLVLPGGLAGTRESLEWLARNVSTWVTISLMAQYYPAYRAKSTPLLSRKTTAAEYEDAVRIACDLGFEHVWTQHTSSGANYRPDFLAPGHPFETGPS